jgi:hypothetical protein
MDTNFHRFLRVFGLCTGTGVVLLAILNAAVDPLGAYAPLSLKFLEKYRGHLTSRAAKAEMIAHGACDVLVLGSSRVLVGIPVNHPAYGTNRVYNLGLNETTLTETTAVLDFALQHNRLKRVLLGADFLLFSDVRGNSAGFDNSRFNPKLDLIEYHFKNLLGAQVLEDSCSLLRQWSRGKVPSAGERGFLVKSVPPGQSQREVFAARIRGFLTDPQTYAGFHYSQRRLDVFRRMVRHCQEAKIELIVLIPPVHALQLETIRAAGLWSTFERWKSDLARIVAEEGCEQSVPLWDFTGFIGSVAESVPPAGDTHTRMKWFIESSHFTPALGELVLARVLEPGGNNSSIDFGTRLTTENVAKHLARLRADRDAYATANPDEIRWVEQIATAAKGKMAAKVREF